jgi:orotidine-5'-phosphate decarboxylase
MSTPLPARDRLIVALDLANVSDAQAMVARLGDSVTFYKVGMELAYASGGFAFAEDLVKTGKQLFLDLKLHDIPTTVTRATAQVARLGASFLTVHAYPQTMAAAKAGLKTGLAEGQNLKLLAVTVMTSYDDADLAMAGYALGVKDLVARRAAQAEAAGVDGLILSAEEAAPMRASFGNKLILVTPGIRPAGAESADQKRIMTPKAAITAGADHLVVGRPILQAPDPKAAAEAVVAEIVSACSHQ